MEVKYVEIAVKLIAPKEHLGIVRFIKGEESKEIYRSPRYLLTHWAAYHDAAKYYENTLRKGVKPQ